MEFQGAVAVQNYIGSVKTTQPQIICGIFSNGLKEEIRGELWLHKVKSPSEIMDLALLIYE